MTQRSKAEATFKDALENYLVAVQRITGSVGTDGLDAMVVTFEALEIERKKFLQRRTAAISALTDHPKGTRGR